jgi:hypothetical protein
LIFLILSFDFFFGDDFIPYAVWYVRQRILIWFTYKYELADVTLFAILIVALVIPFVTYCDYVYFALDSYSLRKITMAFNACARYVF